MCYLTWVAPADEYLYEVKAGWFIPLVDEDVDGSKKINNGDSGIAAAGYKTLHSSMSYYIVPREKFAPLPRGADFRHLLFMSYFLRFIYLTFLCS